MKEAEEDQQEEDKDEGVGAGGVHSIIFNLTVSSIHIRTSWKSDGSEESLFCFFVLLLQLLLVLSLLQEVFYTSHSGFKLKEMKKNLENDSNAGRRSVWSPADNSFFFFFFAKISI